MSIRKIVLLSDRRFMNKKNGPYNKEGQEIILLQGKKKESDQKNIPILWEKLLEYLESDEINDFVIHIADQKALKFVYLATKNRVMPLRDKSITFVTGCHPTQKTNEEILTTILNDPKRIIVKSCEDDGCSTMKKIFEDFLHKKSKLNTIS